MKYLNKTIEYGLYLLAFLLPLQTRWIIKAGFNEYATYSLYGTDILLAFVLLVFVVNKFLISNSQFPNKSQIPNPNNQINPKPQTPNLLIAGLIIISLVSVFFAANKPLALYKLGWLILGVGLFWLVINANYNRLKLIYTMLAGIFLQAVLGVWQFLSQSSFANKWLGLALHNAADLGTSVIEAAGADGIGERWLRAYGGQDHPNILGGILAISVLLLIGEYIKFPNSNNQFPNKFQISNFKFQNIIKIIFWVFLAVFTIALFFSFSRSAWLGLIIGLGVMLVWAMAYKDYKTQKGLAEIILVTGILLFILFSQYQNLITSRLAGEGRLENKSTSERLVSYKESWQMIKNNWTTGLGLGNYTYALNLEVQQRESFYYQPAHNVYLLVLSEIGILGFILFLGLIIYFLISNIQYPISNKILNSKLEIRNWKLEIRENENGNKVVINTAILAALIVMLSLDHWLWSLHFGVLFFWLIIGLTTRNP